MLINKEFLTVQEVSSILNISAISIYRELHNEKLTALKDSAGIGEYQPSPSMIM